MIYKTLLLTILLTFSACGSGSGKQDAGDVKTLSGSEEKAEAEAEAGSEAKAGSKAEIEQNKTTKTVTIYVHGYSKSGYNRQGIYGDINEDSVIDNLVEFTNLPTMQTYDENSTNILAVTPYYGDEAPNYYTEQDIADIEAVTKAYGGGIPRYATIIAKFAKHVMEETNATNVNIVSASMGSLVTRWLIEKDIEQLASEKKIAKWLSIEGVIRGNYAASNSILMDLIDPIEKQHIDTEHMNYSWIQDNLEGTSATHPNYKDIQMSFISSTHDKDGALDTFLSINGQLQANDGVQLLKDTKFAQTPNHTPTYTHYYQDHLGIKEDKGAWAQVATILSSKKRVKITLVSAQISDLHESIYFLNKRAEMVFESTVTSPKVYEKYGIDEAISERIVAGGALNLIKYKNENESKAVGQVIFNDFVLDDENELSVKITGYELDKILIYGVREISTQSSKASLGTIELNIPLKNATIEVFGQDWSGVVKVEILP